MRPCKPATGFGHLRRTAPRSAFAAWKSTFWIRACPGFGSLRRTGQLAHALQVLAALPDDLGAAAGVAEGTRSFGARISRLGARGPRLFSALYP